uniref:Sel1 repeat family protein n=1 Tax=Magnetococcus massalia (strain MO-1) TaxID=451514 RepID=A0A1S7LKJ5_MAGMO|nr:exported protein of unknown function[Include Sel1 repeat] [Candidatus Magnetococcus massalia]
MNIRSLLLTLALLLAPLSLQAQAQVPESSEALNNLGIIYAEGQGVARSYEQAYKWFVIAAAKGHPLAPYNLAFLRERMSHEAQSKAMDEVKNWQKHYTMR